MRSFILTAVLGLGALGVIGAFPSDAKAYWPAYVNRYTVGQYTTMNAYSRPMYSSFYSPYYGARFAYTSPAVWRSYNTPTSFGWYYQTPGQVAYNYSALGLGYYLRTPGIAGYSFSPYTGYQSYAIPGATINVPAGAGIGYGGGYVLP